jgi:amino acid adenylation domain-containing protein
MQKVEQFIFTSSQYEPFFDHWNQQKQALAKPFRFRQRLNNASIGKNEAHWQRLADTLLPKTIEILERRVGSNEAGTFLLLYSLFSILLYKYQRSINLAIDTPLFDKNEEELYVSSIPLIQQIDPAATLKEYLSACQQTLRQTYKYQNFPLSLITGGPDHSNCCSNILLSMSGFHDARCIEHLLSDVASSSYDLVIHIERVDGQLCLDIQFNAAFDEGFIKNITGHLNEAALGLENLHLCMDDMNILTKEEQNTLLHVFNQPATHVPALTMQQVFEKQVELSPNEPAIVYNDVRLTYAELNEQANKLAHHLRKQYNIRRNNIVAVMMNRSERMIIAILGILKAGGAYLPVDPEYPRERKQTLLESSKAQALLSDAEFLYDINSFKTPFFLLDVQMSSIDESVGNPEVVNVPGDLAYVIYTSGSTGVPKGVMIEHHSNVNMSLDQIKQFGVTKEDRVLQMAAFTFDASISEICMALYDGACLVLIDRETINEPDKFVDYIRQKQVRVITFSPSYLKALDLQQLEFLKVIISAGEAAHVDIAETCSGFSNYFNAYGPTECAVCVSIFKLDAQDHSRRSAIPIGKPIANMHVYIVNEHMQLMPIGLPGEICVSGKGLARGYLYQEQITSERFIDSPFSENEKLYRTGDIGRWLPDGNIEYAGRKDNQVKVRGFRIEPEEVELALQRCSEVKEAAVVAKRIKGEDIALVAYYAPSTIDAMAIRQQLEEKLPVYMIPTYFVALPSMPLNRHGKIDRAGLPDPNPEGDQNTTQAPPTNDHEHAIERIWARTLGYERVGIHDNFFVRGGDSIKAIRIVADINREMNTALEVKDIFEYQTIATIAQFLKQEEATFARKEEVVASREVIARVKNTILESGGLREKLPPDWEDFYPMSGIQSGMIYHSLLDPAAGVYHDQMFHQIEDDTFSYSLFRKAVELMVEKHSILRTSFDLDNFDAEMQIVHAFNPAVDIDFIDLQGIQNRAELKTHLKKYFREDLMKPLDIRRAGLWRMRVFRLSENEYGILFVCHHAIIDGWSDASFTTELSNIYFGLKKNKDFRPTFLKASYKDYVIDQLRFSRSATVKNFWKNELSDFKRTELPFSKNANNLQAGKRNVSYTLLLDEKFTSDLQSFADTKNIPVKHLCLAAFSYLLKLTTNSADITVGVVSNGRPDIEDGDKILGCFLNTIPFRYIFHGAQPVNALLEVMNQKLNDLKSYDRYPLPEIARLAGEDGYATNPVFDCIFNYVDFHIKKDVAAETVSKEPIVTGNGNNNAPFSFSIKKMGNRLRVAIFYLETLYDGEEIKRLAGYYKNILGLFVSRPNAQLRNVNVLDASERDQLFKTFNDTGNTFPSYKLMHELFEDNVLRQPSAIALETKEGKLTYDQLNGRANRLAHYLRSYHSVKRNDIVALATGRTEWSVISILAVLKAGAAYVPVPHNTPPERAAFMLGDTNARIMLTDQIPSVKTSGNVSFVILPEIEQLLDTYPHDNPAKLNTPDDLAYVIYTSGTTGQPKGVKVRHVSNINMTYDQIRQFSVTSADKFLQFASLSFDASVYEIFISLHAGATLVLVPDDHISDPDSFAAYLREKQVTIVTLPPSYLSTLDLSYLSLRVIITAGEPPNIQNAVLCSERSDYYNAYGPTECAVCVSTYKVSQRDADKKYIPIGRPIANTAMYVLDDRLDLLPMGVSGDLYISGLGLSPGYLNRDELTAAAFIDNPFAPGTKMYRTGDVAKWQSDGNLVYQGRKDTQVKIRSFRIELGEIESVLKTSIAVKDAAVVVKKDLSGGTCLIAYVVPNDDAPAEESELREYLVQKLPGYMIPSFIITLNSLPLNQNGKVDKRLLEEKDLPVINAEIEELLPQSETEQDILNTFREVLGYEGVPLTRSFFEIGGDSIKLIKLYKKLSALFPEKILIVDLFKYPSVHALSLFLNVEKNERITDGIDV